MSEAPPMLSGTGAVSTWTGVDPADREEGQAPVDEGAHVLLAGGGGQLSTWTGVDPASLPVADGEQALPYVQPATEAPQPQDPPADSPVE